MQRLRSYLIFYLCFTTTLTLVLLVIFMKENHSLSNRLNILNSQVELNTLAQNSTSQIKKEDIDAIKKDVSIINDRLSSPNPTQDTAILGIQTGANQILGFVTISSNNQYYNLYQESQSSSKIVGRIQQGDFYPYYQKRNGFYQIRLLDGTSGWVSNSFLKELNSP